MCFVSLMMVYGKDIPIQNWDIDSWNQFEDIVKNLEILDADLGEPDCVDPDKETWIPAVKAHLGLAE